jgi:glycosyltransferase involved in cell wall biosynthesis
MKIVFLLHNAYGIGGTIRTTFNLASALADRHDVEIASVGRHREHPRFTLDPRVRLTPLTDPRPGRPDATDPLAALPSRDFPAAEKRYKQYNRLTDRRVAAFLRAGTADVYLGTRPGLNVALARHAPRRALRVAQEHLSLSVHSAALRAQLAPHYRRLDALVTTTEADAADYRARLPLPGLHVLAIPNSVPPAGTAPSDGTARVVAAAGRLVPGKRFDLLIAAFAKVAAAHPDWRLRIYGAGPERGRLLRLVEHHGLAGTVELMGAVAPLEPELARASLLAVSSDTESFGMTIVEALRVGVPVVSTDCPHGPGEIIRPGVDGLLVPPGDADALASALSGLIADEPARRRMAAAALSGAGRFDPGPVADRYERLLTALDADRVPRARLRARAAPGLRLRAAARRAVRAGRGLVRRR